VRENDFASEAAAPQANNSFSGKFKDSGNA
jgi:hypothetical protein